MSLNDDRKCAPELSEYYKCLGSGNRDVSQCKEQESALRQCSSVDKENNYCLDEILALLNCTRHPNRNGCAKEFVVFRECNRPGGPEIVVKVVGFVRYSHSSDESFKLLKNIGKDQELDDTELTGIKEVSVYYWDGDISHEKPLLLEVVKRDRSHEPAYYYKYGENEDEGKPDTKVWKHKPHVGGISLQSRLDERNLGVNNRIPLDLEEPDKYLGSTSNLAKDITVQLVHSGTELYGTDYRVTEYKITGSDGNTRFSRVEYKKAKANGIEIPNDLITNIRLYSSPSGAGATPVMIEFVGLHGGPSTFFDTKDGTNWGKVGNSDGFYDKNRGKNKHISDLTEALTNKLDEVICFYRNAVTMDLSINRYRESSSHGYRYCCDQHKNDKKVSVKEEKEVSCKEPGHTSSSLKAYKHSITSSGLNLTAIKFYPGGEKKNRRRITSSRLILPADGPVDIYAIYCGGKPALIHVEFKDRRSVVKGWYRRSKNGDDAKWKKISGKLPGVTPDNITECRNWNKLVDVLKKLKCGVSSCPKPAKRQEQVVSLRSEEPYGGLDQAGAEEEEDGSGDEESSDDSDSAHVNSAPGRGGPKGQAGHNGGGGKGSGTGKVAEGTKGEKEESKLVLATDSEAVVGEATQGGSQRSVGFSLPWIPFLSTVGRVGEILLTEATGALAQTLATQTSPQPLPATEPQARSGAEGKTAHTQGPPTASPDPQPKLGAVVLEDDTTTDHSDSTSHQTQKNGDPSPKDAPLQHDSPGRATNTCGITTEGAYVISCKPDNMVALLSLGQDGLLGPNGEHPAGPNGTALSSEAKTNLKGTNLEPHSTESPQTGGQPDSSSPTATTQADSQTNRNVGGQGPGNEASDSNDSNSEAGAGRDPGEKGGNRSHVDPKQHSTVSSGQGNTHTQDGGQSEGARVQGPATSLPAGGTTEDAASPTSTTPQTAAFVDGVSAATVGLGSWLTFGASSGTVAGAGGLTGFGWWMFKRSKGDPWNESKIEAIKYKEGSNLTGFGGQLNTHSSVSVYYWSQDIDHGKPLLIQLGDSKDKYYKYSGSGDNWTNDPGASNNLRDSLDKQNCDRNKAHVVDLLYRSSTNYPCPVIGCSTQIAVAPANYGNDYYRSAHYISLSSISVSGFKDKDNWHTGLPSVKNLQKVLVYRKQSGDNPLLICYQEVTGTKWFRRNIKSGNTWGEVCQDDRPTNPDTDKDNIKKLLQRNDYYPQITINLSMPANEPYRDKTTNINITVRTSPIGDGYWTNVHSLRGGLFTLKSVVHNNLPLADIKSSENLESITVYYNGTDLKVERLLLVEITSHNGDIHRYFYGSPNASSSLPLALTDTLKIGGSSLTTAGLGGLLDNMYTVDPKHLSKYNLDSEVICSIYPPRRSKTLIGGMLDKMKQVCGFKNFQEEFVPKVKS
ncbi:hypothetical protein BEWA_022900 [Theileria equi strain WA]|uniref:Uncharacterized protein n=1 Tax=Theileria equi strain WA TaxID=1537102 RepID=L0AV14_THEEQ|nr:hypothetical protein BEWA_022900 [Theileria equi strain WA]AFZ79442.1 hypothetical protein BEWA_022900 [Theileria equi strain WA]|eukprot:XP_004829108.1 hypothetical protein BEWA_022900 [Theileria equi strain WA]